MDTVSVIPGEQRGYGLLVVLDASPDGTPSEPVLQRFIDKIRHLGGSVSQVEVCGRRPAAFSSGSHISEGIYVRVQAKVPVSAISILDREVSISGLALLSSAAVA